MHRQSRPSRAGFSSTVAAVLIVALAAAGVPAVAQEAAEPAHADPSALRESIDRAVDAAALSADEGADVSKRARRLQKDPVAGQASGGGKGAIIMNVFSLAVSVATTYWTFKLMKEQQEREKGQ